MRDLNNSSINIFPTVVKPVKIITFHPRSLSVRVVVLVLVALVLGLVTSYRLAHTLYSNKYRYNFKIRTYV